VFFRLSVQCGFAAVQFMSAVGAIPLCLMRKLLLFAGMKLAAVVDGTLVFMRPLVPRSSCAAFEPLGSVSNRSRHLGHWHRLHSSFTSACPHRCEPGGRRRSAGQAWASVGGGVLEPRSVPDRSRRHEGRRYRTRPISGPAAPACRFCSLLHLQCRPADHPPRRHNHSGD
jgi:hypothetical protein